MQQQQHLRCTVLDGGQDSAPISRQTDSAAADERIRSVETTDRLIDVMDAFEIKSDAAPSGDRRTKTCGDDSRADGRDVLQAADPRLKDRKDRP